MSGRTQDDESPFLLEALQPPEPAGEVVPALVAQFATIARRLSRGARPHLERALVRQLVDGGVRGRPALAAAVASLRRALGEPRAGETEALEAEEAEALEAVKEMPEAESSLDESTYEAEGADEADFEGEFESESEDEFEETPAEEASETDALGDGEAEDEAGESEEEVATQWESERLAEENTEAPFVELAEEAPGPPIDVARIKRLAVGELGEDEVEAESVEQEEETPGTGAAQLPFLLAGPIVRRADPSVVWFWFACKEEVTRCTPRLTVYEKDGTVVDRLTDTAGQFRLREPEWRVTRLAERLWVVLVAARPKGDSFPLDLTCGYDLEIEYKTATGTAMKKLSSLDLKITYQPFKLPTFLISRSHRTLAHGSCRRPGGYGHDAFMVFNRWLSTKMAVVSKRPSALFLTGDQIYADDVAGPLFRAVQKLAHHLCGYVEQLPRDGRGVTSVDYYVYRAQPGYVPDSTRKGLTSRGNSPIGFTTEDGEGHLLSFAEYAAMYLLVWNPEFQSNRDYLVDDGKDPELKHFQAAVGATRRVLANVVTYMVFDDHDITDDWNLDSDWEKGTRNSTARRIIANGLAAYWAFQGWGNDPDAFDNSFRDTLARHFATLAEEKGYPAKAGPDFDKILHSRHWSFVAPTALPALCVDIRTRRETPKGKSAVLSGPLVWPELRKLAEKHKLRKGGPLLIVLPTPLLPHRSLLWVQGHVYQWPRDRYEGDYEFYGNNPRQRAELILFLRYLLSPPALIVFSGDVHHGFVVDGLYVYGKSKDAIYKGQGDWAMRIAQVTSSPIKNIKRDVYQKKIGVGPLKTTDLGNLGESAIAQVENQYATTDDGSIALRAAAQKLKGPLGRETFVFENHLCVVDIPLSQMAPLNVLFVGEQNGLIATAEMWMTLTNNPSSFMPPILGFENPTEETSGLMTEGEGSVP